MNALQGISSDTMQELFALTKGLFDPSGGDEVTVGGTPFQKSITTSLGMTGYNLAAPAQRLYPVLSPLRNMIPRKGAPIGATTANWKAVTGINTGRIEAAVAFGTRNSDIAFTLVSRSADYKSFGLDGKEQDEAVWYGRKFDDVRAFGALAVLQALMIEEENLILGGVSDVFTLGTPATPTGTRVASDAGTWSTTDHLYVKVAALPLYGVINSYTGFGVGGTPLPLDLTQALGRHSSLSAVLDQTITAATDSFTFAVTPTNGAFAYAWYVKEGSSEGADSGKILAGITTAPQIKLRGNPSGANVNAGAIVADTSGTSIQYDGLYGQVCNPTHTLSTLKTAGNATVKQVTAASGSNYITRAIIADMVAATPATTTDGSGGKLTSDGAGGCVEVDGVLKAMWDFNRVGPGLMLMHSQVAQDLTKLIAGGGGSASGLQYRINLEQGEKGFKGGIYVGSYTNKFTSTLTPGSPDVVDFMIHPNLPPGQILFISFRVPYPTSNVENVLEIELQQEYADFQWARSTREYQHGVYANGVLKHQFPAGCAILRGIGAAGTV